MYTRISKLGGGECGQLVLFNQLPFSFYFERSEFINPISFRSVIALFMVASLTPRLSENHECFALRVLSS